MDAALVEIVLSWLAIGFLFWYPNQRSLSKMREGVSWRDLPEKDRHWVLSHALGIWGGLVIAALFIGFVDRSPTNVEILVVSVVLYCYIERVTVPWFEENEFYLPWSADRENEVR